MANSCIRRVSDTLWEPQNARNFGVRGSLPFCPPGTAYFRAVSCLFHPFWKISVKLVRTGKKSNLHNRRMRLFNHSYPLTHAKKVCNNLNRAFSNSVSCEIRLHIFVTGYLKLGIMWNKVTLIVTGFLKLVVVRSKVTLIVTGSPQARCLRKWFRSNRKTKTTKEFLALIRRALFFCIFVFLSFLFS